MSYTPVIIAIRTITIKLCKRKNVDERSWLLIELLEFFFFLFLFSSLLALKGGKGDGVNVADSEDKRVMFIMVGVFSILLFLGL